MNNKMTKYTLKDVVKDIKAQIKHVEKFMELLQTRCSTKIILEGRIVGLKEALTILKKVGDDK